MTFGNRLRQYRKGKGLTQEELAKRIGVAKTTIAGYESDNREPDVEKIKKISKALGVSGDVLIGNTQKNTSTASSEAMKVARDYDFLDAHGRRAVRGLMDEEIERIKTADEPVLGEKEPVIIPDFLFPAAAGFASPVPGEDFENYELQDTDPRGAVFAIHIQGDSMEPAIRDEQRVFCNRDPLAPGDVGIFCVDGEIVCKQWYTDPLGITYLFSLNRKRASADVVLPSTTGSSLACLGRVMLRRRYPIPSLEVQ